MFHASGRVALMASIGAVAAAAVPASPCRGAVIPAGLHARAEALEWIAPYVGVGAQDLDTGHVAGPGMLATATASMTPSSTSSALGFAHYGFLVNDATVNGMFAVGSGQESYAQANTKTSFRDNQVVVLSDSVAPGTAGTLTAQYVIDRVIDFDLDALAGFGGAALVIGGFNIDVMIGSTLTNYSGTWTYNAVTGVLTQPSIPNGLIQKMVPFQYGVPFTIAAAVELKLTVYTEGVATSEADAQFSLGPAFIWDGITAGLPEDATVSSPDVPDWRAPYGLPAPGAGALALLTAAGACARRTRR